MSLKYLKYILLLISIKCIGQTIVKNNLKDLIKYESNDGLLQIETRQTGDSITGKHCFKSVDGKRMDCCLDIQTLFLTRTSGKTFKGVMKDCNGEKTHEIEMDITGWGFRFFVTKDDHAFIPKTNNFIFSKNKVKK